MDRERLEELVREELSRSGDDEVADAARERQDEQRGDAEILRRARDGHAATDLKVNHEEDR